MLEYLSISCHHRGNNAKPGIISMFKLEIRNGNSDYVSADNETHKPFEVILYNKSSFIAWCGHSEKF
jgi:hypothetical protein